MAYELTEEEMDAIVEALTELASALKLAAKEIARLRADVEDLKEGLSGKAEGKQ